jgi:hypothetical protein
MKALVMTGIGGSTWQSQNVVVFYGKHLLEPEVHAQYVSQPGSNCFIRKPKAMENKLRYVKGAIQHLLKESIMPRTTHKHFYSEENTKKRSISLSVSPFNM